MRRLFSTFATGPPGVGLLVIRLAVGAAVGFDAIGQLTLELAIGQTALLISKIGLAMLLLAGLWTPLAGTLVAILRVGSLLWHRGDLWTDALVASSASPWRCSARAPGRSTPGCLDGGASRFLIAPIRADTMLEREP